MATEERPNRLSLNVDIGARAELKAEVPSSSTGRLVEALTDMIRPFTEARGLRADQIRLQREDVLIEVARRARKRLDLTGEPASAVPTKTLVPLLEKASLEDPDDHEMIERWANLLAVEAANPGKNRRWCIDILSSIDAYEARLLDDIYAEYSKKDAYEIDNYTSHAARSGFERMLAEFEASEEDDLSPLIRRDGLTMLFHGDDIPNTNEFTLSGLPDGVSFLHLQMLGLLWVNAGMVIRNGVRCFLVDLKLSPLGFEFVHICHGSNANP